MSRCRFMITAILLVPLTIAGCNLGDHGSRPASPTTLQPFRGQWAFFPNRLENTMLWVGRSFDTHQSFDAAAVKEIRQSAAATVGVDAGTLSLKEVRKGCGGTTQIEFAQQFGGYEVLNGGVLLNYAPDGRLISNVATVFSPPPHLTPPRLPDNVEAFVLSAIGDAIARTRGARVSVRSVIGPMLYANGRRLVWVIKAELETRRRDSHSVGMLEAFVSVPGRKLVAYVDYIHTQTSSALVFTRTPRTDCTQGSKEEEALPPDPVQLEHLCPNATEPSGTYAKVGNIEAPPNVVWNCKAGSPCSFLFDYNPSSLEQFAEVMTYYHVTSVQCHIRKLGFTGLSNGTVEFDVSASSAVGDQLAEFRPVGAGQLLFGTTDGLTVARDPKVIVHEYGHAIEEAAAPRVLDQGGEPSALNEGFADYLALSTFAAKESETCRMCVGGFLGDCLRGPDTAMRVYDRTKRHNPKEVHEFGFIWTRALWFTLNCLQASTSWDQARDVVDRGALLGICALGTRSFRLDMPTAARVTLQSVHDDAKTSQSFQAFCDGFKYMNILDQSDCDQILRKPMLIN